MWATQFYSLSWSFPSHQFRKLGGPRRTEGMCRSTVLLGIHISEDVILTSLCLRRMICTMGLWGMLSLKTQKEYSSRKLGKWGWSRVAEKEDKNKTGCASTCCVVWFMILTYLGVCIHIFNREWKHYLLRFDFSKDSNKNFSTETSLFKTKKFEIILFFKKITRIFRMRK